MAIGLKMKLAASGCADCLDGCQTLKKQTDDEDEVEYPDRCVGDVVAERLFVGLLCRFVERR